MKKIILLLSLSVSSILLTAQNVPSYVPTNGLIGWWPFSSNAIDSSGNGNNGTVYGATLTTDRFGNANSSYDFDGNDRIDITGIGFESEFSIGLWYQTSSYTNPILPTLCYLGIEGYGTTYTRSFDLSIDNVSYNPALLRGNLNYNFGFAGTTTNSLLWNSIYVTLHNSLLNFYFNGILVQSVPATKQNIKILTTDISRIGCGNNSLGNVVNFFSGKLDDIGIWNRALTQQEITNLYNSSLPTTSCVPNYVSTTGLVGWWPFCGNANDESGNGNNGTVMNGVVLASDRFGSVNQAYSFDGVDDYISMTSMNNIPLSNNSRSISVWMNPASLSTTWTWNAVAYGSPSTNNAFMFGLGNNIIAVQGWATDYSAPLSYTVGQWIHTVCTYDGLNVKIYVNGILIGSGSISTWNTVGTEFYFGIRPSMVYGYFPGQLDDIGIWNRALTQQEITLLYEGCLVSVTSQPNNQSVSNGNSTSFIVNSSNPSATYQWQTDLGFGFVNLSNAGQYSGVTNDTLTVSNVSLSNNNQQFRCIVSAGACIDTSDVAVLTVNNTTNVDQLNNSSIKIYPNPASIFLMIENADFDKSIGLNIRISNMLGQILYNQNINQQLFQIDLTEWSGKGLYLLEIVDHDGKQLFIQKLVID